jgi:hypothetical protein
MATKELRDLLHKYKVAYTTYMHCVHALSDATHKGEWPSTQVLDLEQEALDDLMSRRHTLLDALHARTHAQETSAA